MKNFIKKIIKAFTPISREEMDERYYSRSTSIPELEDRIRKTERQRG